jgi:hypothetical protein
MLLYSLIHHMNLNYSIIYIKYPIKITHVYLNCKSNYCNCLILYFNLYILISHQFHILVLDHHYYYRNILPITERNYDCIFYL